MSVQKLLLLRHGDRESLGADPQLTAHGLEQAENLLSWYRSQSLKPPHPICASPRGRTQATVAPLATHFQKDILIRRDLDQRLESETGHTFERRVRQVASHIDQSDLMTPIVLCSHVDWLLSFATYLNSEPLDRVIEGWRPGRLLVLARDGGDSLWTVNADVQL
jgi:broad specificity phosphatase PhoE